MPLNFIFDFAGTLADLSPSSAKMLKDFLSKEYSLDIEEERAALAYDCVDRHLFYSSVNIKDQKNKKEFYKYYNDLILKNLGVFDIVNNSDNQLFDYFVSIKRHWVLKEGVRETFKKLKQSGKTISIISNFDSKLKDIVSFLNIDEFIDNLHISQDEGFEKPDVRFYETFFKKYGLDIKNSVYTGDSYELDFEPALKIGLRTFLIDERGRFVKRDNVIEKIPDILKLI